MTSSLWLPRSTCDSDCLPGPGSVPGVTPPIVIWRTVATIAVLLAAAVTASALALVARRALPSATRLFARATLAALGVDHAITGRLPSRRALLVANHVSWLDVVVLLAHAPVRLLAKREVLGWPVIGRIAAAVGTVFVDRTKPKSLPAAVGAVRAGLAEGGLVAVFPEGTTWCGRTGGAFRPAMFQAAIDVGAPVVPVRVAFSVGGAPTTVAAFLGEETLTASLRRVVSTRGLTVGLRAGQPLHPERLASRRALARAAGATVAVGPQWTPVPARAGTAARTGTVPALGAVV